MSLWNETRKSLASHFESGAAWYLLASALPSAAAVGLGPLVLRKTGMEGYALLGLATYFSTLIAGYTDFSTTLHLIGEFSKKSASRVRDLANAFFLKLFLTALAAFVLGAYSFWRPRNDELYVLLAVFLIGMPLSSASFEWYFLARRRYREVFLIRAVATGMQVCLVAAWLASDFERLVSYQLLLLAAGVTGGAQALWMLGGDRFRRGLRALKDASPRGVRSLALRLFPMSASLLLTPYFLAYALPWYLMTQPDPRLQGSFSIAYRLITGAMTLMVPLVVYGISRNALPGHVVSFARCLKLSAGACGAFWVAGVPVIWLYFQISAMDLALITHCLRTYSVLLVGIFFLSLRIPYVSRWVYHGGYGRYFLALLCACTPTLLLSWTAGADFPAAWVAWCALVPELVTTVIFVAYDPAKKRLRPASSGIEGTAPTDLII